MYYQTNRKVNKKGWIRWTFCIVLVSGLIAAGYGIKTGVLPQSNDRFISVQGTAETEVTADKIIYPLVYKDLSNDLNFLHYTIGVKKTVVIDFLKVNGILEEEMAFLPPEISDTQADMQLTARPYQRYMATSAVIITSTDVDKVRRLAAVQCNLLKNNVVTVNDDGRYKPVYEYTGMEEVKCRLTGEALENARQNAVRLLGQGEGAVGGVKCVTQLPMEGSGMQRSPDMPHVLRVRAEVRAEYFIF